MEKTYRIYWEQVSEASYRLMRGMMRDSLDRHATFSFEDQYDKRAMFMGASEATLVVHVSDFEDEAHVDRRVRLAFNRYNDFKARTRRADVPDRGL